MIRLLTWTDEGELRLQEFESEHGLPAYAILSHTWHADSKQEVSYDDLQSGRGQHKAGYGKIEFCKKQASDDELAYVWIDTCCINRKSEPELSEAVNSMFRWYKNAARCYVYLSDVDTSQERTVAGSCSQEWETLFPRSRWWTRGWTLQELIAPKHVYFFAREGMYLGNKSTLETVISGITGIPRDVLRGRHLAECTIEERMTWAKARSTTREEDHVYSLFGIFDVTMPLIYGEGKAKAFRRLYEEISRYAPLHVGFTDGAGCDNAIQEIELLQKAMQKLEARLTISLTTQSSNQVTTPATYQTILNHEERQKAVIKATETSTENANTNIRHILCTLLVKSAQLLSVFVAPLGYFEKWSSFHPEEYATNDLGPQIICYSLNVAEMHSTRATVTQDLFVAKTRRQWIRIKLRMKVTVGTTQWKVLVGQKWKRASRMRWIQLPDNVISLIQKVMTDHPDVSNDTEISIRFNKKSDAVGADREPQAISHSRMINNGLIDKTWNFTEVVRHQNVRMIPDTALVTAYILGICLVANLDNRWVAYRTATAGKWGTNLLFRLVRASVALRGAPHVAQLVGIIVDSEKNLIKGMLIELPSKGPMFRLMDAHRFRGKPIPWPMRQKWAKQIVQGLVAYHDRGQVVAQLRTYKWCVCVDDCDNAIVTGFSTGSHPYLQGNCGLIPPEYRTEAFKKGDGQVGPGFDIFQLGLLLWHLYRDQHQQGASTFCSLAGCNNAELGTCKEHGDPIALPKAAGDVPAYLDSIIALCRQEDPRERPTARKLVHMFPEDEEITRQIDLLNKADKNIVPGHDSAITTNAKLTRLEIVRDLYGPTNICMWCSEQCRDMYYHCQICELDNFDMCHECFLKGNHCWDKGHLLARYNLAALANKESVKRVTYFSSTNRIGVREEVAM